MGDGRVRGVVTTSGHIPASVVMLAIGHSARDTYEMLLRRGVPMVAKPFQMGVRIEQPQEQVNRVQYGKARLEEKLGAADYSLIAHGRHDLFTFCMCAGGYVMPSVSESGAFCTNGMSLSRHDSPFANSGLVVTIPTEEFGGSDVLAGVRLQQVYERRAFEVGRRDYLCPIQRADDFLAGRDTTSLPPSSYQRGAVLGRIEKLNPKLNAFCLINEQALAEAEASEKRWMSGQPKGLLDGVPVSIKDLLLTKGWPTLRGSKTVDPSGSVRS